MWAVRTERGPDRCGSEKSRAGVKNMQHTEQVQGVPSGVGEGANKPEVSGKASCNARGDRVRAMLRVRFGEDIYSSWFASMEFENFDGRVVRASVPVKFLKNWIQSHYSDDLLQCCAAEFTGVERVDVMLRQPGFVNGRPPEVAGLLSARSKAAPGAEPMMPETRRVQVQPPGPGAMMGRTHVNGFEGS